MNPPDTSPLPVAVSLIDESDTDADAAESERRHFVVDAAGHGQRLDRLLALAAAEFSRNHLQGLVEAGHVSVDGQVCTHNARRLRGGWSPRSMAACPGAPGSSCACCSVSPTSLRSSLSLAISVDHTGSAFASNTDSAASRGNSARNSCTYGS